MADDFFEDSAKENVELRSGEITGHKEVFHSLPKEFQNWHNTLYIQEKEGSVDTHAVPEATLNAHMWKAIFEASGYAVFHFGVLVTIGSWILHFSSWLVFILGFIIFLGFAVYAAFHFYFFGIIRAQIVGPLTKSSAMHTAGIYNRTFFMTYASLFIMVFFTITFMDSVTDFLFRLIVMFDFYIQKGIESGQPVFWYEIVLNILIVVHNFMVETYYGRSWFFNPYTILFLFTFIQIALILIVERMGYNYEFKKVIASMYQSAIQRMYPIEKAQRTIAKWRSAHGM